MKKRINPFHLMKAFGLQNKNIYGFEAAKGFIIHYSVRDNGIIRALAACVILGINQYGRKEVLIIEIGENESSAENFQSNHYHRR